jgi:chemotaxis protein CheX
MKDQLEQIEELTQQAVREVFQSMLSMDLALEPAVSLPPDPEGEIIGSVGFIGQTSGVIHLKGGLGLARMLTSRMLGITVQEVDGSEMVNDAIGELSNMVGGFVKSRLCDRGWSCTLTIPSIVRGQQLSIEASTHTKRKILGFGCGAHHLLAELLLKESAGQMS